jgi:hypothetical protein
VDDYERVLPQALALERKELVPLNVNLEDVVAMVLGRLPQLLPFREGAAALRGFDPTCFDELGAYARAAGYAHSVWQRTSEPPLGLAALVEQGTALRAVLLADIAALRAHQLIPADTRARLDARVGFKKLGFDLLTLAGLLRQHWPRIEHKIPLELGNLEHASWLAERIINAVGTRQEAPQARAAAAEQRLRNFTLLVRAYEEVRRAIAFLQPRKRQLEQIAPSLYVERQRKRHKPAPSPETPAVATAPHFEPPARAESHELAFAPAPRLLPASSARAPHTLPFYSGSPDE